jgi:hypothetical protein
MPTKEAELLELMRADRLVLNKRQAEQGVVDREAAGEVVPAVRIERVSRRRPRGAGKRTAQSVRGIKRAFGPSFASGVVGGLVGTSAPAP